jgi:hypothetical protein
LVKSPGLGSDLAEDRKIFARSRPSAIPFVVIGAAALNSTAVLLRTLRQSVSTLADLRHARLVGRSASTGWVVYAVQRWVKAADLRAKEDGWPRAIATVRPQPY